MLRRRLAAMTLTAGIAFALPAPAASWVEYRVVAPAGQCGGLPPTFAVASQAVAGAGSQLLMQAPGQLWRWQSDAAGQVREVLFWAADLKAGVAYHDPLELAAAPSSAELRGLLQQPKRVFGLACGGKARPVRRWDAPVPALPASGLLDQADLADMDGNPIAGALSRRIGRPRHQH